MGKRGTEARSLGIDGCPRYIELRPARFRRTFWRALLVFLSSSGLIPFRRAWAIPIFCFWTLSIAVYFLELFGENTPGREYWAVRAAAGAWVIIGLIRFFCWNISKMRREGKHSRVRIDFDRGPRGAVTCTNFAPTSLKRKESHGRELNHPAALKNFVTAMNDLHRNLGGRFHIERKTQKSDKDEFIGYYIEARVSLFDNFNVGLRKGDWRSILMFLSSIVIATSFLSLLVKSFGISFKTDFRTNIGGLFENPQAGAIFTVVIGGILIGWLGLALANSIYKFVSGRIFASRMPITFDVDLHEIRFIRRWTYFRLGMFIFYLDDDLDLGTFCNDLVRMEERTNMLLELRLQ